MGVVLTQHLTDDTGALPVGGAGTHGHLFHGVEDAAVDGLEAVPDIREIHLGEWQGLSFEEVDDRFPGLRETRHADIVNYRIPGSETVAELSARVVPAVEEIAGRHRGESVAIVAHAGPNRMVLCHALGVPLKHIFHIQQDYGAINVLDFSAEGAVVRLMNG